VFPQLAWPLQPRLAEAKLQKLIRIPNDDGQYSVAQLLQNHCWWLATVGQIIDS